MQTCRSGRFLGLALAAAIALVATVTVPAAVPAQTVRIGNQTVNLATLVQVPPDAVPRFGNFYSLHHLGGPPLPGVPPAYAAAGVPVYWLGGSRYLIDDEALNWDAIRSWRKPPLRRAPPATNNSKATAV